MSLTKVDGGWKVRWRDAAGKHRSRTIRHGDGARSAKEVARDFHDEVRYSLRFGRPVSMARPTLGEIATEWAAQLSVAPKTEKLYGWLYSKFIAPTFADEVARDIRIKDVETWLAELDTGDATKQKAMALLHQIFEAALRWEYVDINPAARAKRPKLKAAKAVRPPTPLEVEGIRSRLKQGDAALVSTLAYAGLRPQEALGLRWSDVRDKTLLIDAPKTDRSRSVRLMAPLAVDLKEWKMASPPSDLVFPGKRGRQITDEGWSNWRSRIWHGTKDKPGAAYGMGITPYALRHLFVSLLIREGLSIVEVAAQAGHSAQVCLRTYAHEIAELQGIGGAEDEIWKAREQQQEQAA